MFCFPGFSIISLFEFNCYAFSQFCILWRKYKAFKNIANLQLWFRVHQKQQPFNSLGAKGRIWQHISRHKSLKLKTWFMWKRIKSELFLQLPFQVQSNRLSLFLWLHNFQGLLSPSEVYPSGCLCRVVSFSIESSRSSSGTYSFVRSSSLSVWCRTHKCPYNPQNLLWLSYSNLRYVKSKWTTRGLKKM